MRWEDGLEEPVLGMLDDLELQAEGLHLAERATEVSELSVAQYAEVELLGRLHASVGRSVRVGMTESLELHGRLAEVGTDWLQVDDGDLAWLARLRHVALVEGLASRSVPEEALPLSARLSLRSVLRRLAADRRPCVVHLRGGRSLRGDLVRVGADFVEVGQPDGRAAATIPIAAVVVVQSAS